MSNTANDARRYHEQSWPGFNSRWLAYCYAVGRHPSAGLSQGPAGAQIASAWISRHMNRALITLGIGHSASTSVAEYERVTALIWEYAHAECQAGAVTDR